MTPFRSPGRGAPRRILSLLLIPLAASCGGEITASVEVASLTRISPRPGWDTIYAEVEACTGVEGDFDRVGWFSARSIAGPDGHLSGGAWLVAREMPHGIALLDDLLEGEAGSLEPVLRHEMIHEVLQLGDHGAGVWCRCDARPDLFEQCR